MLNKVVIAFVLASLVLSGMSFYKTIQNGKQVDNKIVLEIKKKFGTEPSEPLYNPIVKLSKAGRPFCSGFVIDANYAITAGHCLGSMEDKLETADLNIILDTGKDSGTVAHAVGFNGRVDLGLITGNFNKFKSLKVDMENFRMAMPLAYACGFPFGQIKMVCNPVIPQNNDGFLINALGYLVPGMSGGVVIDPKTGEGVALNTAVGDGVVKLTPLQGFKGVFKGLE